MSEHSVGRVNKDKAASLIETGAKTVWVNSDSLPGVNQYKTAAIKGSMMKGPPNKGDVIVSSNVTVFVENKEIAIEGAVTAQGRHLGPGSNNVFAGNSGSVSSVFVFSRPEVIENAPTPQQAAQSASWSQIAASGTVALPPTDAPEINTSPLGAQATEIKVFLDRILPEAKYWTRGAQPQGPGGNQNIMSIFKDLNVLNWATSDSVPWCAAFVNFVLKNCGYKYTQDLSAAPFLTKPEKWGANVFYSAKTGSTSWRQAQPGDIAVWDYDRGHTPSHVNFVYAYENGFLTFCGGNQSGRALNNNNPSGSSVTAGSKWNPSIDKSNAGAGTYHLMALLRPQQRGT